MWGADGVEREQQICGVVCQNEKKWPIRSIRQDECGLI